VKFLDEVDTVVYRRAAASHRRQTEIDDEYIKDCRLNFCAGVGNRFRFLVGRMIFWRAMGTADYL
jgi:hypothetical protein